MNKFAHVFLLLFLLICPVVFAQKANDSAAVSIIERFEKLLNLETYDITTNFTLIQKKQGEPDRVLRITINRRDSADLFTIIFQYPDSEKGKGYLRDGDDLYLYLPTTREFVYRNRKDDIGSTDVRTDIFGKLTNLDKYRASYIGTEQVSKWECDVVKLDALALDVSFPIQKWYVRKSDGLPVKVENFSVSGTLLRTFYYVDYQKVGPSNYIFTKLMAVNHLENNQRTLITNENIKTDRIADSVFTKAYLEQQSR